MGRKKVLEKRLARLKNKKESLRAKALASEDANEVRSINERIEDINDDIEEVEEELDCLEDDPGNPGTPNEPDDSGNPDDQDDPMAQRNMIIPQNAQMRGGTPMATYTQNGAPSVQQRNDSPYATMEYRQAFMAYVQRGIPIPKNLVARAGGDSGTTIVADIGAIVPETIMNEFIKKVSKVYGHIYSKVRKLNVQGGVKFPIEDLKAQFTWITETKVSDRQKAGDIKEYVEFAYNMGEIRVSQSLLSTIVSLSLFEERIVEIMVEAYVEMMDKMIISGTGVGQPLGITNDPRVTNVVEFTEEEFSDWTAWKKKLFAKVPLSKRGQGEFLFTGSTVETYLETMKDKNDRPIFKEATDLQIGALGGSFFGRDTDLVEPDVISDFDIAEDGDVVGIFWIPGDYAVNTNAQWGIMRYFDHEKNEWVDKGLTVVDGKILDAAGCYLIKKKVAASKSE